MSVPVDRTATVPAGESGPELAGGRAAAEPAGDPPRREPGHGQPARGSRLAWLDALRGIAALCVVYAHFGTRVLPRVHQAVYGVFDPGLYGVLVFFLVSGYIVPASLERRGNVRTFWVGRLFRLFPLFVFAIAVVLLLHEFGLASVRNTNQDVAASVLSHLFMLNDLLGPANIIVVLWTLSYEMVFYLLLTALFTAGWHRRSGWCAAAFAAGALLLGGVLPTVWLSYQSFGMAWVALAGDVLVLGGLAAAIAGRGWPRALGAWVAATAGLILVALNERRFAYEGLTILALMFTGTMLYRAQHRQVSRWLAAAVAAGVFAATITAGAWHIPALVTNQAALTARQWAASVAFAGLTFAAGLLLSGRRVPAALAWLGLVSYSVYLLHPLLLDAYDSIPFPAAYHHLIWAQIAATAVFAAVLLGGCALTHRFVEAPIQRIGRRAAARLDARQRAGRLALAHE